MVKIIVQIPAYNEAENIWTVIKHIPRTISWHPVEVMVIDDGSTDNTAEIAKNAWADHIIIHDYNRKIGCAFKTWVEKFFELKADILVNIDADGQFDPLDIPKLVHPLLARNAEIVLASRFGKHKPTAMPWIKYRLNKLVARVVSKLLSHPIDDLTCGFRAYSREALMQLNLIESFTYTQEVIIDAIGKRIKMIWLPVQVKYFAERKSRVVWSIASYIGKSFMIIFRTVRDVRPLVFFGLPGLIAAVIGFFFLLAFLILYLSSFKTTPYRTFLNVGGLLFGLGILLLIFATLADMMKGQRRVTENNMYLLRKIVYDKE